MGGRRRAVGAAGAVQGLECPLCGGALDLVQPVPADGERLIGGCEGCGSIFTVWWIFGETPRLRRCHFPRRHAEAVPA